MFIIFIELTLIFVSILVNKFSKTMFIVILPITFIFVTIYPCFCTCNLLIFLEFLKKYHFHLFYHLSIALNTHFLLPIYTFLHHFFCLRPNYRHIILHLYKFKHLTHVYDLNTNFLGKKCH